MGLTLIPYIRDDDSALNMSYSSFGAFREFIAEKFYPDWEAMFDYPKYKPFAPLMNHSDCDGSIDEFDCERIAEDFEKYKNIFQNTEFEEQARQLQDLFSIEGARIEFH